MTINIAALARRLGAHPDDITPLASRGVAHDHFRVAGAGLVLRVPRLQALQGLDPAAALARQAAAFTRAAVTGHAPRLERAIAPAPDDGLPYGALLVREINGRTPRLPDDMPAIAAALAALHALPLPAAADRAPLPDPLPNGSGPVGGLLGFVRSRWSLIERAGLPAATQALLNDELTAAERQTAELTRVGEPLTLVGVDVHPGNFLIEADGRAVLTDLERAQYGHPAADLAHASLTSSTRWDPAVAATLTPGDSAAFYTAWEAAAGAALAESCRPAFAVLRRLVWLRTLTWMAHWRDGGRACAPAMPAALLAHMDAHAAAMLSSDEIEAIAAEWR